MVTNRYSTLLTTSEVAKILYYHVNSVRRLADSGTIRSFRIGSRGDRRFSRQDVTDFIASHRG